MQDVWPNFVVLARTRWIVGWAGTLRPICQPYVVRVWFSLGFNLGWAMIRRFDPAVTVIDPVLRQRFKSTCDPIPHLYRNVSDPSRPILCLFDPDDDEWQSGLAIADTTIPWAIDWLACYEGWLATGDWTGGGRHPISAS